MTKLLEDVMAPRVCQAERYKMRFRIREYLDRKGLNMKVVAQHMGVNKNLVWATVSGLRNNRRVLRTLRDDFGVPESLLFIPKDKEEA